jgi:hypothetical protein
MNRPIRTTVIFALISGFLALPFCEFLHRFGTYQAAFKWFLWADLAVYALLLVRWCQVRLLPVLFPLVLLLGAACWPHTWTGFLALALGVLCWIRSGICFTHAPFRSQIAELMTIGGGVGMVTVFGSSMKTAWPLGLCLFILVQALYFYIVPESRMSKAMNIPDDPFEHASQEAEKVLALFS